MKQLIRAIALKDGNQVYTETYEALNEKQAVNALINSMYWNYCSSVEVSEKGWFRRYTYKAEQLTPQEQTKTEQLTLF